MRTRAMAVTAIALGGTLAFSACALRAAEGPAEAAVERAETAHNHAAIAEQYTQEADELRKKVTKHKVMLRAYENRPFYLKVRRRTSSAAMVRHCRKLIDNYTQAAAEAEALAQEHRDLAAKESR